MERRRRKYHQSIVIPFALITTAMAFFAGAQRHTFKINSPIVATKEAADRWAKDEAKQHSCLTSSIDIQMNAQGFAAVTGSDGPYFTTLRCNETPKIYWRWAAMLILPWAVLTMLARLWFAAAD